jgi:hypothetical protein
MTYCGAITKKGTKCKNSTKCALHRKKSTKTKSRSRSRTKTRSKSKTKTRSKSKTTTKARSRSKAVAKPNPVSKPVYNPMPKPVSKPLPKLVFPFFTPETLPANLYDLSSPYVLPPDSTPFHKTDKYRALLRAGARRIRNFVDMTKTLDPKTSQTIGVNGLEYVKTMNENGFFTFESGEGLPCSDGELITTAQTGKPCVYYEVKYAQLVGFMAKSLVAAFKREVALLGKYAVMISKPVQSADNPIRTTLEYDYCRNPVDGEIFSKSFSSYYNTIPPSTLKSFMMELTHDMGYGKGDIELRHVTMNDFDIVHVFDKTPCREGASNLFRDVAAIMEKINNA